MAPHIEIGWRYFKNYVIKVVSGFSVKIWHFSSTTVIFHENNQSKTLGRVRGEQEEKLSRIKP